MNGYSIHGVFSDITSGISFDNRRDFFKLLDEILEYKVERILITFKDRLSRVVFGFFIHLSQKYGIEIVTILELGSPKLDVEEVFEEIVSLLHCYSLKLYSKRRKESLEIDFTPNSNL